MSDLCLVGCDCEVEYVSCEFGPTVEFDSYYLNIAFQGKLALLMKSIYHC